MIKAELKRFESNLKREYVASKQGIRSRGALVIEASANELDRIQDGQIRDLAIDTLDRDSKRLRQIVAALGRVATGTFGVCLECEEEISGKRLTAIPWTDKCIACQEAADREARQWGAREDKPFLSAA